MIFHGYSVFLFRGEQNFRNKTIVLLLKYKYVALSKLENSLVLKQTSKLLWVFQVRYPFILHVRWALVRQ